MSSTKSFLQNGLGHADVSARTDYVNHGYGTNASVYPTPSHLNCSMGKVPRQTSAPQSLTHAANGQNSATFCPFHRHTSKQCHHVLLDPKASKLKIQPLRQSNQPDQPSVKLRPASAIFSLHSRQSGQSNKTSLQPVSIQRQSNVKITSKQHQNNVKAVQSQAPKQRQNAKPASENARPTSKRQISVKATPDSHHSQGV